MSFLIPHTGFFFFHTKAKAKAKYKKKTRNITILWRDDMNIMPKKMETYMSVWYGKDCIHLF